MPMIFIILHFSFKMLLRIYAREERRAMSEADGMVKLPGTCECQRILLSLRILELASLLLYNGNLIFQIVIGCGIARFGRRGLKTA